MAHSLQIPPVIPNDWDRLRVIINKLKHLRLGLDSSPEFESITVGGLNASEFVMTDASKVLTSEAVPLSVSKGGIGVATLTDHGILLGSGTDAVTPLGAATNGQLPIGSTGADPVLAALTGTANQITVTNGAGSITLSTPQDIATTSSPTWVNNTLTGYIDLAEISAPATPAANNLRLYVEDIQGFSFYKYLDSGGMKREVLRDSMILVYNNSGSTIVANRVVYASGSFNNFPTIALAKSNSTSTMPAIGVTIEDIANNAYGRIMQVGLLEDIDTSSLTVGDILYVHDTVAGLVRITPPATPNLTQEIGTVLVDNASTGAIQVIARGLTGDEYGTAQNAFSIGDGAAGSKTLTFNAATDASIVWDEAKFDLGSNPLLTTGAGTFGGMTLTGNLVLDTVNISTDTTTGTQIGTGATQKLGFFGVTPAVQQAHIVDADGTLADVTSKFNTLLSYMETLGLLAVS